MSGDKCLKIHIGVKCHLASNVTCLLVVKCLWRQLSQTLTGIRGPASKVWATNVLGVKQLESIPYAINLSSTKRDGVLSRLLLFFVMIDKKNDKNASKLDFRCEFDVSKIGLFDLNLFFTSCLGTTSTPSFDCISLATSCFQNV